ncbi:MAG: hypothetical protein M3295_10030 [Chloroflexota bacterium]|nr:hypothetical protein [Chloroflexota bacterium]
MGDPGYSGWYSLDSSGLYPGDDVIDWIGWDPSNWYLCHNAAWKSFGEKVTPFYNWLLENGHGNKRFMLSEWGSRERPDRPLDRASPTAPAFTARPAGV